MTATCTCKAREAAASPVDTIDSLMNDVMLAAIHVGNVGGLLETLSATGYSSACAANDDWSQQWWSQATYLAHALDQFAAELKANGEAIETALSELRHGRAAQ
jgi:hypothetical protein